MAALPAYSGGLWGFIAVMFVKGVAMGYISTGSDFYIDNLLFISNISRQFFWGVYSFSYILGALAYLLNVVENPKQQGPAVQAFYLIWCAGATVSPFIVQAFLSEANQCTKVNIIYNNVTDLEQTSLIFAAQNATVPIYNNTLVMSEDRNLTSVINPARCAQRLSISFFIIGAWITLFSIPFWTLLVIKKEKKRKSMTNREDIEEISKRRPRPRALFLTVLFLLLLWTNFCMWVEVLVGSFLTTWAISALYWSPRKSALLTSALWGAYCLGRLAGVPLAAVTSACKMITTGVIVTTLSYLLLIFFYAYHEAVVWTCITFAGLGMAWPYAAMLTWAARYMNITGNVAAVFQVGNAVGRLTSPIVTGFLMEERSPSWMLYLGAGAAGIRAFIYLILEVVIRKRKRETFRNEAENLPLDSPPKT